MQQHTERTLARQWTLLRCIPAWPRRTTIAELIAALEDRQIVAVRRTIERDLQGLSEHFPLSVDDTSKPHGWSWAKGARQEFTPRLSTSQCVALLLTRTHLKAFLPRAMLKELVPLFDSAAQEVASSGWKNWHKETAVIPTTLMLQPAMIAADVMDDVQQALAHGRCLSGRYRAKGNDTARNVTVHPLGMLLRGPVQYLVVTMFDYPDIRQLALHRFTHTKVLQTPRKKPEGFEFQKYLVDANRYNAHGAIRLVAWFDESAAEHLRETPLSHDQTLKPIGDGSRVELTATVESDEMLRWWLLAFGGMVEVREPEELRTEFAETVTLLRRIYGR